MPPTAVQSIRNLKLYMPTVPHCWRLASAWGSCPSLVSDIWQYTCDLTQNKFYGSCCATSPLQTLRTASCRRLEAGLCKKPVQCVRDISAIVRRCPKLLTRFRNRFINFQANTQSYSFRGIHRLIPKARTDQQWRPVCKSFIETVLPTMCEECLHTNIKDKKMSTCGMSGMQIAFGGTCKSPSASG